MALTDQDKEFLRIPLVTVSFLSELAKTTGLNTFASASAAIELIPVEQIAETLASLRTDEVFIALGTMEIEDGVSVEIYDEE